MHSLGTTRSHHAPHHLLHTPDAFIRAPFPGMVNATAIVHAAPALGAAFVQYTAEMNLGGLLAPTDAQRFLYVIGGEVQADIAGISHALAPGGFAFLPTHTPHRIRSDSGAHLAVIEKRYEPVPGIAEPEILVGDAGAVPPQPLFDDPAVLVRPLLPANDRFDCAVNLMTFQPGATLPMVEVHVMEHGLLILDGGGIYRLGDCWHSVTAGDFIWMAPYCPQWFAAVGKVPARYLIYKDFNRAPLLP